MATYSPRRAGSDPGMIPMTFRAGACERVKAIDEKRIHRPVVPVFSVTGSPPSSRAATAGETTRLTRAGVVSADIVTFHGRITRGLFAVMIARAPAYLEMI